MVLVDADIVLPDRAQPQSDAGTLFERICRVGGAKIGDRRTI